MQTYTVKIPAIFYHDHMDRLGDELGLWEEIRKTKTWVEVRMDHQSYLGILGDAEFYADRKNHDCDWAALINSAKRTVKALRETTYSKAP